MVELRPARQHSGFTHSGNLLLQAVVLPRPARGAGTLSPSAQRFVWAAKQALGKAALGALFA